MAKGGGVAKWERTRVEQVFEEGFLKAVQGHQSQKRNSIKLLRGDAVGSRTSIIAQNVAQTLTFSVILLYSHSFYILYFLWIFY